MASAGGASVTRCGGEFGDSKTNRKQKAKGKEEWRTRFFFRSFSALDSSGEPSNTLWPLLSSLERAAKTSAFQKNKQTMARHRPPGNSSSDDDDRGGNGGPPAKRVKRFRHKSAAQAAKEVKRFDGREREGGGMSLDLLSDVTAPAASTRLLASPPRIAVRCQGRRVYATATTGSENNAVWVWQTPSEKCIKPPFSFDAALSPFDAISFFLFFFNSQLNSLQVRVDTVYRQLGPVRDAPLPGSTSFFQVRREFGSCADKERKGEKEKASQFFQCLDDGG